MDISDQSLSKATKKAQKNRRSVIAATQSCRSGNASACGKGILFRLVQMNHVKVVRDITS
jgi:hypothetical protein